MASFGGNWAANSATSGIITGQLDETNFNTKFSAIDEKLTQVVSRCDEIGASVNSQTTAVTDTYGIVSGGTGVSATWSLVDGLRIDYNAWLGYSGQLPRYTWSDTANRVELANQQSAQALVDLVEVLSKLRAIESVLSEHTTKINSIVGSCGTIVQFCIGISQGLSDLENHVKAWLHGILGSLFCALQSAVAPIYGLCHVDGNAACGNVNVDSDFACSSTINAPPDGVIGVACSYDAGSQRHQEAH